MANLKRQGRIEWRVAAILLSALLLVVSGPDSPAAPAGLDRVRHIVVLYLENRSFDNLYGLFPGAEGLQNLDRIAPQVDEHGEPYKTLPRALDSTLRTPDLKEDDPSPVDPRIPANLPNHPFRIDSFVPLDARSGDLVHRFLTEQRQIHGGKMDRFIVEGNTGSLPLGYYDGSSLAMWNLAQEFTLADHFFHAAFGGSFLNHFWLICACSPEIRPEDWAILEHKMLGNPSAFSPQDPEIWDDHGHFWAVNLMESVFPPHHRNIPAHRLLPAQTHATIGDRLSEKGISWAWYAGGWADAVSGHADSTFQYHHQPSRISPHTAAIRPEGPSISKTRMSSCAPSMPIRCLRSYSGSRWAEMTNIPGMQSSWRGTARPRRWSRRSVTVPRGTQRSSS